MSTAADPGATDAEPAVERTDDGRYIVVDGRRWRASDPSIPDGLRAELVAELMAARRAVGAGKRVADDSAVGTARRRVHDAKVALGERGAPWWEDATDEPLRIRIEASARALLRHRDPVSSICPSDVARVVGGSAWRDHLDAVRSAAADLASDGRLVATQGESVVDISAASGPVRLRRGDDFPD